MTLEAIFDLWCEALQHAWSLTYGEALNLLRDDRRVSWMSDGVHPPSARWGEVIAYEKLMPELRALRDVPEYDPKSDERRDQGPTCDAHAMRQLARNIAREDWARELLGRG
jgi:hypothetical protein